jgi:hypothetical protein
MVADMQRIYEGSQTPEELHARVRGLRDQASAPTSVESARPLLRWWRVRSWSPL